MSGAAPGPALPGTRRALLRWSAWFAVANAGVLAVVGLRYLWFYPFSPDPPGLIYVALAYVGQFALLAALPLVLLTAPLSLLLPRRRVVMPVAVVAAAAALTWIAVDANLFAEQRYHLSLLTAVLFERSTWLLVAVLAFAALVFEVFLAGAVRGWVSGAANRRGVLVAVTLMLAWCAGQGIHIWGDALGYLPVTQFTRYLPAYYPVHSRRRMAKWGLVDPARIEEQRLLDRAGAAAAGQLAYPLQPLRCAAPAQPPLNILMVLIDGLRPDAIDPSITPAVAALRNEGQSFADHWSGGNSSRMGIFSFFYGLPATYWEAFYGVQQPPVLMQEIRSAGYDLGLFSVPGFSAPTDLDRTSFAGIPGLQRPVAAVSGRAHNVAVTDDWLAWLGRHDPSKPFFGFVYYDPPLQEMSAATAPPLAMDNRFTANAQAREEWRRYRLAAQLADHEFGRIVADLRSRGLLDRTLLIVFSDHGNEFDDNGLGYIGHGSAFSAAQLHATLVMRWPGREAHVYQHRTAHQDVPVTLLQDLFGCTNPPADYASGQNLFAGRSWDSLIAGSYDAHAIVQPGRVIVTSAGGFVEVLGADYRPVSRSSIEPRVVDAAMRDMRRFYR